MLAQKEVARDFLQLYLPAQFLSICDLNTLPLASGSFIEEDLRSSYSDILYSLQMQHGAGYIYALIEHQSLPDKLMAFRLMRYTLPLVVPILFYHGTVSPWPHTLNWLQLYLNPLYAAGGIHGKARATHSRTGEAVGRVQGANDDDCRMAGRERL